jgi:hypothetical protein
VAYDEELAARIRDELSGEPGLSERRMFGGLAFLLGGHMAVVASGQGGLMVRVPPERSEELVAGSAAEPMVMTGRPMAGWLVLPTDAVADDAELASWVGIGRHFVRTLPPKS